MKTTLTLVTGGARSGKSTYALEMVNLEDSVLFVATAQAFDDDMRLRIANHKLERPSHWGTVEAPQQVGQALLTNDYPAQTIIIDCLTMLTSNIILSLGDEVDTITAEQAVKREVDSLLAACQQKNSDIIIVTNEVGLGGGSRLQARPCLPRCAGTGKPTNCGDGGSRHLYGSWFAHGGKSVVRLGAIWLEGVKTWLESFFPSLFPSSGVQHGRGRQIAWHHLRAVW